MENRLITISDSGVVALPANVQMRDFEIAELFGVVIPTIRSNIRTILKTDIVTADCTNGATLVGCNVVPDYHGLNMVVALAFRIQLQRAEMFRRWVIQRCVTTHRQQILLLHNYHTDSTKREINH